MTWTQAIIVALLYYFSDAPFFFGEGYYCLQRPVVAGFLVGLVMGNPVAGAIIGATINLIFLGHMSVGGSIPSDMALAGYVGTAFALALNTSTEVALAMAVPISLLGTVVWVGRMSISSIFVHWADGYAEKGDAAKVRLMNWLPAQTMLFVFKLIVVTIFCRFGSELVGNFLNSIVNSWAFKGLGVIGGMLPALGIALNLRAILKKDTWAYLLIGFVLVAYFKMSVIGVSIVGLAMALIYMTIENKLKKVDQDVKNTVESAPQVEHTSSILNKRDVQKCYWNWQFFSHANYNYERMQGTSFASSMSYGLEKLYPEKPALAEGLKRHLVFFNTDPNLGAVIHGATLAMEEQKAGGADISGDAINAFKTGLMGPMAGIGDSIVQGVIIPMIVALGISIAIKGNVLGSLIVLAGIPIALIAIAYNSWMYGYKRGGSAVTSMMADGKIKAWIGAAGVLGCTVMGALISNYVNFKTALEWKIGEVPFNLQTGLFDSILPNLLPLALTLILYWLTTKNVKVWKLLLGVAVVGFVGGALGIFG
ncbi:MAG: PTS system mannose/fructose/sorbose family transporter subunit IID [Anaerolineaceae bacterium]|nr:PTS system mannose/fructose/sorbose family transporter subunit IID [Anaerolineaceae bacterium]